MRRLFGLLFGAATQLLFVATVPLLVGFLAGHEPRRTPGSEWTNALLALQFAVPHSLLLHPATKRRLTPWVPPAFYGCLFCVVTCLSLLATIRFWHESPQFVVRFQGTAALAVRGMFIASWGALLYSLSLGGLGYQTGLIPWWDWARRRPQRPRAFVRHGAYRVLRHPVYLSFLGLVWFTPVITLDRLVLIAVWTPYIFLGSCLKDRRLTHYLHDVYREYMARVPGYPGMLFGPLARRPFVPTTMEPATLPKKTAAPPPGVAAAIKRAA